MTTIHLLTNPFRIAITTVMIAVLGACSGKPNAPGFGTRSAQSNQEGNVPTASPLQAAGVALPDFTPLIDEYGDAVVNVEVVQERTPTAQGLMPEDPFAEFFRRFGIPLPEMDPRRQPLPMRGAGSGFIVDPSGYILTNAHVVESASTVTVRLTDRREFVAKVVGSDARSDVAVLKIEATELPTVRIGDPSQLKPGQWVLAIGSPFGLQNSATAGIVSATARTVGGASYVPFIQTDVAVNPGNSGGPLFNLQGEVVGINSMIFSRTGGYMGLSFAIPIDVAIDVRDQLIENGRVVRGRIGVTVQDLNASLARTFGLDRPRGALVSSVEPKGPADNAGLKPGDVITAAGDREIDRSGDLSGMITALKPGTEITLQIWREGKSQALSLRVGELQERRNVLAANDRGADDAQLGLAVRPLSPEEQRRADTEGSLVVEQVSGPAALSGVQPGDIVLGVNRTRVESLVELRNAVKSAGDDVALLIERGDAQVYVPIRTG